MVKHVIIASLLLTLAAGCTSGKRSAHSEEEAAISIPSTAALQDGIHHWNLYNPNRTYARYDDCQYEQIADNLIAYQNPDGGWLKNMDWAGQLNADSVKATLDETHRQSTLDNRNTFSQIEYLGDVYSLTKKEKYRTACEKGLLYLLTTQKSNGGWRGWDVDAITFNDDVTTGALELFRNILQGDASFLWLDDTMKQQIKEAYDKGLAVVLKTQWVQDGVKTAWAQQYDNETYQPVKARTFELPGLTAWESTAIVIFLMGIESPSAEVINAIECAMAWFEKSKIQGIKVERVKVKEEEIYNQEYPFDNVVVQDSTAPAIWARFYELSDNRPFMATRTGEKVWRLADVNPERRTGYDWYGYWPEEAYKAYDEWKKRMNRE